MRLQNKWRQETLNSSFLLKKAVRNPFEPIDKTMLKYGMAKQHAVNKTNQLQNASGPKQSEDQAPGKRQTDRFKMKYPLITIVQRMQVKFKRLQKWIPLYFELDCCGRMPLQSQRHTFPSTDRTCVKSLSRKCLEQHWGFANYIVRFPMRNPDSASYSIVRLCTRVRFIETKVSGLTQYFQLSSTVFAPEPPTCFVQHVHTCVDRCIRFEVLG